MRCKSCGNKFNPEYAKGWCPYYDCGKYRDPSYKPEVESTIQTGKDCPRCGRDVKENYSVCPWCGQTLREAKPDAETLLSEGEILLDINGEKMRVSTDEVLGSNVRTVLRSQGKPDKVVRKIHSEHARLLMPRDTLLIRKEGTNPVLINDRKVDDEEVLPVSDGDIITLSDVVRIEIDIQ